MKIVSAAIALVLLACPVGAAAQAVNAKVVVAEIAGTIEDHYFDAAGAKAVAAALRSEADAGPMISTRTPTASRPRSPSA